MAAVLESNHFSRVVYFQKYDSEGLIFLNSKSMIVSFAGTESISDWITNTSWSINEVFGLKAHKGFLQALSAVDSSCNPKCRYPLVLRELALKSDKLRKDRLVNSLPVQGHWAPFMSITQAIKLIYDQHIDQLNPNERDKMDVWLTGHSLGGALAHIAGALLDEFLPIRGVYTFGSPRPFAVGLEQVLPAKIMKKMHRIRITDDSIPNLPLMNTGLMHIGNQYTFQREQKSQKCFLLRRNDQVLFERLLPGEAPSSDSFLGFGVEIGLNGLKPHSLFNYFDCLQQSFVRQIQSDQD